MTNKLQEAADLIYSEEVQRFTTWKNTNDVRFVFKLVTDRTNKGSHPKFGADCKATHYLRVVVDPGKSVQLPTEYDQAIRTVDVKTMQVVGGLCPLLTKVGEEDMVVHKSLDYKAAWEEQEVQEVTASLKKERELEEALTEIKRRKANQTKAK